MTPLGSKAVRTASSWVEVDTVKLNANIHAFRDRLGPGVQLTHVVKANAYGHGLDLVAREDEAAGLVDRLAVINVNELQAVRDAGVRLPVHVLGHVPLGAWSAIVDGEGTPVVFSRESIEALSRESDDRGRDIPVHLKVETGTYRYGVPESEVPEYVALIGRLPGVHLEGLTTHFANIEDTTDHGYAREQLDRFRALVDRVTALGVRIPLCNTACSAATILFPESHFGMVRVGISSYGIWPSKETRVSAGHLEGSALRLEPALTWKTRVGQVKEIPAGAYVGYGCSWRAPVATRLAVLPVGYADGYDRALGNVGHVLIRGQRAPVRGRVCMNVTMVDVTHIDGIQQEDEVVLLGNSMNETISADQMAGWCGTIAYEVVARIAGHLPRVRVQQA